MNIHIIFCFSTSEMLRDYTFFDIGHSHTYFDREVSEAISLKTFNHLQKPALENLLQQCQQSDQHFTVYLSGPFVLLLKKHAPELINNLKRAIDQQKIELLGGTYFHSLSYLISEDIFLHEVQQHTSLMKKHFACSPSCFYHTANLYTNSVAASVQKAGFTSMLAPKVSWYLGSYSEGDSFCSTHSPSFTLKLVNPGFRIFSEKENTPNPNSGWQIDPTSPNLPADWLSLMNEQMKKYKSKTVSEAIKSKNKPTPVYNIPQALAMDYQGRDLSFYLENPLQKEIRNTLRQLSSTVSTTKTTDTLASLSTAELWLQLSTKIDSSEKPYLTYQSMMNALVDLNKKR